jgi:hypothetical protein
VLRQVHSLEQGLEAPVALIRSLRHPAGKNCTNGAGSAAVWVATLHCAGELFQTKYVLESEGYSTAVPI